MKRFLLLCVLLSSYALSFGQLTGTKYVPTDYSSLEAAINDLNNQGVGPGGVTIILETGNPQTAPSGGYVITASGNPNSPIVIDGNGNTITSSNSLTAGALNDAFFKIIGGDNITIKNFVMIENPSNTNTTASTNNMTEFGVALFYATQTDGPQNCTIEGNTIQLGPNYQNAFGIYANSRHNASSVTTTNEITSYSGAFHNLNIVGNTISSVNMGIVLVGSTTGAYMTNNVNISNNNITYGRTGTFSSFVSVSGSVNGILLNNILNVNVNSNILTSPGTSSNGTLRGIYHYATGTIPTTGSFTNNYSNNTIDISNNTNSAIYGIQTENMNSSFTVTYSNNTIQNLTHIVASATSGVYGVNHNGQPLNTTLQGNTININAATSGSVYAIYANQTIPANGSIVVEQNTISINKTIAGGSVYGFYSFATSTSTVTKIFDNNLIKDIVLTGNTSFYGIYDGDGSTTSQPIKTVQNNTIKGITGGSGSLTAIHLTYGSTHNIFNNEIYNIVNGGNIIAINAGGSYTTVANTYNNNIYDLRSTDGSVSGIIVFASGTNATSKVYNNNIYNLTGEAVNSSVAGINITNGTTVIAYNNFISGLYSINGSSPSTLVAGIAANGATNVELYNNTVYIDSTSTGSDFSTAALYSSSSPSNVKINNNIFVNISTPKGTGKSFAFQRSEVSLAKYNSSSDNNIFYVDTSLSNCYIYGDGTNYLNFTSFQTFVAPREQLSFLELPPFINVTTAPYDLHIKTDTATFAESGGQIIPGITDDFDGDIRFGNTGYTGSGHAPDIGADEFDGIAKYTCSTPNPGNTVASETSICYGQQVSLSLENNTPGNGVLYQWQSSTDGSLFTDINNETNSTTNVIPTEATYYRCRVVCLSGPDTAYSNPVLISFTYEVLSTTPASRCGAGTVDLEATVTTGATPFWYDAPTGGNLLGSGSPFTTPVINTTTTFYVEPIKVDTVPASFQIGQGNNVSSTAAQTPFATLWHDARNQYLFLASELQAAGLSAGNITQLAVDVASVGSPAMSNFTISIGNTNLNAFSTPAYETGLTTVFTSPSFTFTNTGWQTITFDTPFYWDGNSNIIIQFCYDNDSWSSNSNVQYTNTPFNSHIYGYQDNSSGCSMTNPSNFGVNTARLNVIFHGNFASICQGPRVPVVATVNSSNPIAITSDTTLCNNGILELTVTEGQNDYDEFTWSPTTYLFTDAACTIPYVDGTNATTVYFKSDFAGVHTIMCLANNTTTSCGASANINITVLPSTVTITASPENICHSGSTTISVSPNTGFGPATFQFAESQDGQNYTDIPGANGFSYTTGNLTSSTYYQWTAYIGSEACIQQNVFVNVLNPAIASVSNDTLCGIGNATISANAANNELIYWFNSPTDQLPVGFGNSYTTSQINSTTDYYAEPVAEIETFSVGKQDDPANALSSFSSYGMYFASTIDAIIKSIDVYPAVAGNLKISLVNDLNQEIDSRTFTITSADISTTNKKTLNLNFYVPANVTGWSLRYDINLYRGQGSYSYPYTVNGFSITGNTFDGNNITGGTRMYFYNWQVSTICKGTREQVKAVVTSAPEVNIVASNENVCQGTNVILTAQSSNTNYVYTWSNGSTGESISVNPIYPATYTLTATDADGCIYYAQTYVNVYPTPTATATVDNANITCGQTIQLFAGSTLTPEYLLEDYNGFTHSMTAINTSTGGTDPSAAAWTLRQSGYTYSTVTFVSNDNSQFIMSNSDAQGVNGITHTELISETFSTVGVDSASLSFYHYYRHYSGGSAKVEIFDGNNWNTLQQWTSTQGTANNFAHVQISLPPSYLNNPNLKVRFVYDANWGYYWAIDNAQVSLYKTNTFSWASSPAGFNSNLQNPTDNPATTTQYLVVVTSAHNCTNSANVTVNVNNMPAPNVTVNNACDQSILTADNYTGTLNWSTGEATQTIVVTTADPVTVYYTDGNCVSNATTVYPVPIQTPDAPNVDPISICEGQTVPPFVATSNYNQFIWYSDPNLTNPIGVGNTYQSSETTPGVYYYYVIAANNGCYSDSTVAILTIFANPTVNITQNGDTLFSSETSGNQWYNSQGPINGATDDYYVVTVEDDYHVVVTDANGCTASSDTLHVIPTVVALNNLTSNITLSPNPAHSYAIVNLGKIDNAVIELLTADGKLVSTNKVNSNVYHLSLKGLPSGIYTVKILTNDHIITKKLIVN